MKVKVETRIYPSENSDKVIQAVKNIFPNLDLEKEDDFVRGFSESLDSLEKFKNLLGLQAIRGSARRIMRNGVIEDGITFCLNKQVATVSKISFSGDDTPLGPIKVTVKSDNVNDLIDYLAPSAEHRD